MIDVLVTRVSHAIDKYVASELGSLWLVLFGPASHCVLDMALGMDTCHYRVITFFFRATYMYLYRPGMVGTCIHVAVIKGMSPQLYKDLE